MWMLQLFGCGIFPHTGSHQSRLTGHWLHSITERPGLEKKNTHKRQMSSLKPCTTLPPQPPPNKKLQFPLLPGMNKSVQLPCFTPGSPSPILFRSNVTIPAKRPNLFPQSSQENTIGWQITWEYICLHRLPIHFMDDEIYLKLFVSVIILFLILKAFLAHLS